MDRLEKELEAEKKEKILLDADLIEMIDVCAFRAVLTNGHEVVAYGRKSTGGVSWAIGQRVTLSMSPFDMNRGEIIPQET